MYNPYQIYEAKILIRSQASCDTVLLRLTFKDKKRQQDFQFLPGQFMQIGLLGWGECPISICSSPTVSGKYFELAIRDVGRLTHRLNQLNIGETVFIRGPFGNGFNEDALTGKTVALIGGGCGFVPLRSLILRQAEGKLGSLSADIYYGCLNEKTILFKEEMADWKKNMQLNIVLDKPSLKWKGAKGLVTSLLEKGAFNSETIAVLVGPPVMYRFAISILIKKGVKPENIHLSLERKMYCGLGVCQHCAIGPYYVCKDGPVFTYNQLKGIPGAI